MSFFNKFSYVTYKFNPNDLSSSLVLNILNSAKFLDLFPERSNKTYVDYIVKDGEKPEHIADRVYGRSHYHWIVLMSNKIYNPYWDWPLSSLELEDYCAKKYTGTVLFFPCIGTEATRFSRTNSEDLLPETKSQFVVGNVVTQIQNSGFDSVKTVTGVVKEWNPTYRRIVVDNIQGGVFTKDTELTSKNLEGTTFKATPKKVVFENQDSVHHFVDDFNNYMDPYAKIKYREYDDNRIFVRTNIFYNNADGLPTPDTIGDLGSNDFILNKYIQGWQGNTITNRFHEELENDAKRKVKILRKEYASIVVKQMDKLFK